MLPVPPPQPPRARRTETTVRSRLQRLFDDWLIRVSAAVLNGQSAAQARQKFVDCLAPVVRESSSNIEITDELAVLLGNRSGVLLGSGLGSSGPEAFGAAWQHILATSPEAASAGALLLTASFLAVRSRPDAHSMVALDEVLDLLQTGIGDHRELCFSGAGSIRLAVPVQVVLLCAGDNISRPAV